MNAMRRFSQCNKYLSTLKKYIRDIEVPICANCVHFIEDVNNYPYDSLPNNERYGRCKLYGEKNIITGEIKYDFAFICRSEPTKCRKLGHMYSPKQVPNETNA
jgi:hypothetical protein